MAEYRAGAQRPALRTRNVRIGGRRTSVRLEPAFWQALETAAKQERIGIHDLCTKIDERSRDLGLTAAIRVFLLAYIWSGTLETALETVPGGNLPDNFKPAIR